MNLEVLKSFVDATWEDSIVPALIEYIKIPNRSQHFDPGWRERGEMERAVKLVEGWCRGRRVEGMTVEVIRHPERTPLLYMEVPGDSDETVLLYGHLDKQPEMVGWSEGLGPWTPVRRGDRLYGRGAADDGYAAFASVTAIEALQRQHAPHARLVVLIEAGEESGSPDLPAYIQDLGDRIGSPSLVVCLDSGCGTYDQLWLTTSLRGAVIGNLEVSILTEGVHSGDAGGVVPSSFRIARQLLSRLEDEGTGRVLPESLQVDIPADRIEQARSAAAILGEETHRCFPFVPGAGPMGSDPVELILNRTWRPSLSVTGAGGLPALADAGNVLRPKTALKLSLRLPPTCNAPEALAAVKRLLETDPPYGALVSFAGEGLGGWNAPPLAPWLERAVDQASRQTFGKEAVAIGEGGSIPFMGMLGARFPEAQFLITGVLGPGANAHGPNEFLHIPTGRHLTAAVSLVLAQHFRRQV